MIKAKNHYYINLYGLIIFIITFCFTLTTYAVTKKVSIGVGTELVGEYQLDFNENNQPCFNLEHLKLWSLPDKVLQQLDNSAKCLTDQQLLILGINSSYTETASIKLLHLIITKSSDSKDAKKDSDDQTQWDDGINAFFINYAASYTNASGSALSYSHRKDSLTANIDLGLNLASWRFRYLTDYDYSQDNPAKWYTRKAFVETDIKPIRSRIIAGDTEVKDALFYDNLVYGSLFNAVLVRGAVIRSDDSMQKSNQHPILAPIEGVATTNAEVRITQDGQTIYKTSVPPGPFILNNIRLVTNSSMVFMSIRESNGTYTLYQIPYSSISDLAENKQIKYILGAGKVREHVEDRIGMDEDEGKKRFPNLYFATLGYGLPRQYTLYGGTLFADDYYNNSNIGIGKRFENFGDLAFSYYHSRTKNPFSHKDEKGDAYYLRYAKTINSLNSSLNVTGTYYPTNSYHWFKQALRMKQAKDENDYEEYEDEDDDFFPQEQLTNYTEYASEYKQLRYKIEAQLKVTLDLSTNIFLTAQRKEYFEDKKKKDYYSLSYNSAYKKLTYNFSLSYTKTTGSEKDLYTSIGFRIPLADNAPQVSYQYSRNFNKRNPYTHRYNIQDSLLEEDNLSYSLSLEKTDTEEHQFNGMLDFDHMGGNISANYINNSAYRAQDIDIKGSAMIHSGGLTFGQPLGNTHALVYIKDAADIKIDNQFNTKTNRWGYAIATELSPYQNNAIAIDTLSLPDDWEIEKEEINIVPTYGAISLVAFVPPKQESDQESTDFTGDEGLIVKEEKKHSVKNINNINSIDANTVTSRRRNEKPKAVLRPSLRPKLENNR